MDTLLYVLTLIGIIVASISGALVGIKKEYDAFGICILGLATATGGGLFRDLVLGNNPPACFVDPVFALVAIGVAIITLIPFVQKYITQSHKVYDRLFLIFDSLGLGVFTVIGIKTAYDMSSTYNWSLYIFVGAVTGVGGGVVRDLFAGDKPSIFVKHFYACASIIGSIVAFILWHISEYVGIIAGITVVIVLRLLAAKYRWELPGPKHTLEKKEENNK